MINVYLKYSGTILVLSGIMLHNLNIFPLNIIIHLLGVVAWSLYGLNIKDKAIILNFGLQIPIFIFGIFNFISNNLNILN